MPDGPDEPIPSTSSRFLAELSHEIRSPLHAILGLSELLTDGTFGELNGEQQGVAADIHAAAQHLLHIFNDVLDLSRLTMGKLDLQPEVLRLATVVDQALRLARGLTHEKRITLEARVPGDLAVHADERRVLQVLHNLLVNAIHSSPPEALVLIAAEPEETVVWTMVQDHGNGISPADQERIFEAFVTIKCSNAEPGVGLGLSVCRSLLQAMGGAIGLQSAPGQGCIFRFSLPRAEPPNSP